MISHSVILGTSYEKRRFSGLRKSESPNWPTFAKFWTVGYVFEFAHLLSHFIIICLLEAALMALSTSGRDLSMYVDADLSLSSHVSRTRSHCFALRQLWSIIRHFVKSTVDCLWETLWENRLPMASDLWPDTIQNALFRLLFSSKYLRVPNRRNAYN
jgi:hypothetical protein